MNWFGLDIHSPKDLESISFCYSNKNLIDLQYNWLLFLHQSENWEQKVTYD